MRGQLVHNTQPHARLPPSFLGMDDLTTETSFDSQATRVIGVFDLCFDVYSIGDCTAGHWKTSGRLVQDLNGCTVGQNTQLIYFQEMHLWKNI